MVKIANTEWAYWNQREFLAGGFRDKGGPFRYYTGTVHRDNLKWVFN